MRKIVTFIMAIALVSAVSASSHAAGGGMKQGGGNMYKTMSQKGYMGGSNSDFTRKGSSSGSGTGGSGYGDGTQPRPQDGTGFGKKSGASAQ